MANQSKQTEEREKMCVVSVIANNIYVSMPHFNVILKRKSLLPKGYDIEIVKEPVWG